MESTSVVSRSASPMMSCVYSFKPRLGQLALEQLRRAAQAAERVFDLVRELPHHQAAAVEARQQIVLARDALALRGVGDLQQQLRAGEPAEGRDGDIERAHLARRARRADRHLAIGDALAALQRAPQDAAQAFRVVQEVAEGAAARHLQAEGEQVLRGDVGVHRAQLRDRASRCRSTVHRAGRRRRSARAPKERCAQRPWRSRPRSARAARAWLRLSAA